MRGMPRRFFYEGMAIGFALGLAVGFTLMYFFKS